MPQRMGMSGVGRGRLARRGPAAVQAIHGALRPFGEEHRHGVGRDEQRLADELRVGGIRASEHVVEHRRTIARVPDTDAQPPERIAHVRDHIAHAVVAGGAATLFEPYHARGEVELVVRHQHRLDRDLVVIRDAAHRVAAAVHVAHGLEQPQILSADARTCELRLVARLAAEGRLVAAGELVDDLEAGVVTGARVLDARIAEPDDQLERLTCHVVDSRPKRRRPPGEPSLPRAAGVRCRARCGGYFLPPSFFPAAASFFGAAASFFSSPFFASPAAAGAPGAAAGAAPGAPGAPGAPAASGAAPSAGTAAAASAATGSGSSARGAWIETTGALRRVSSGIATPGGSGMSARNLVSLRLMPERSSSRNSGRSFGRQLTSTSARMCETTPPWLLTPGDTLSPLKWIGRRMRILSFSTTRCRSTCTTRFLAGCICTSLMIASSVRSPILSRTIEE